MKPKSKIDSKLVNLETETFGFRDRGDQGKTFQKSNSGLPRGETAVSMITASIFTMFSMVSWLTGSKLTIYDEQKNGGPANLIDLLST